MSAVPESAMANLWLGCGRNESERNYPNLNRASTRSRGRRPSPKYLQGRIGPEDLLGAVAVMHVEIDHGDAMQAVLLLGMAGCDGGVVEDAEAHRPDGLGVVARRALRHESVGRLLAYDFVDRVRGAAD